MSIVQVYVEGRILKQWVMSSERAVLFGRKMHRDFEIEKMRAMDITCGVQVLNDHGEMVFENFGCMRAQSKMNDPDFELKPEWFDNIINGYVHEQIHYVDPD